MKKGHRAFQVVRIRFSTLKMISPEEYDSLPPIIDSEIYTINGQTKDSNIIVVHGRGYRVNKPMKKQNQGLTSFLDGHYYVECYFKRAKYVTNDKLHCPFTGTFKERILSASLDTPNHVCDVIPDFWRAKQAISFMRIRVKSETASVTKVSIFDCVFI